MNTKVAKKYRSAVVLLIGVLSQPSLDAKGDAGTALGPEQNRIVTAANGPLRINAVNSRYFSDGSGRPIYLTGVHGGGELQDNAWGDMHGGEFDYENFLSLFTYYNLNFMRMWVVETTRYNEKQRLLTTPMPYKRTGPGRALDGELKFELTQFNPQYFNRLRSRVAAAGRRGIYVMVMLFQGFSIESKGNPNRNPWVGHPYHFANNVNGINGDMNGNGEGEEVHMLKMPAITRLQEAYVRKIIDTVNDLDNVLYEIANESHNESIAWQYHMIRYIHDYEKSKPKQHPVVMTVTHSKGGDNSVLFASPAAAISPNKVGGYGDDPPAADGTKIIINDTDHVATKTANHMWVWKSFLRGLNPILLWNPSRSEIPQWELIRRNLGYTREYAHRIDLGRMVPQGDLVSSGYCLAHPGGAYLAYLPYGRSITVDLRAAKRPMKAEWFSPSTGETLDGGTIEGGARTELTSPFMRRFTTHWMRRNFDGVLGALGVERPAQTGDSVLFLATNEAASQP